MWWCKFAQDNSYLISFFQPIIPFCYAKRKLYAIANVLAIALRKKLVMQENLTKIGSDYSK